MSLIKCPECGASISDKAPACPSCGCPVSVPKSPSSKKIPLKPVIFSCIALFTIILSVFFYNQNQKERVRSEYITNLNDAVSTMLDGASTAESVCNLTKAVWYNTIYEKSDKSTDPYTKISGKYSLYSRDFHSSFDTSISKLYASDSIKSDVANITLNRDAVSELMSNLSQPTSEFSTCYTSLLEMYDYYNRFTSLALSPTGSLQTYSDSFRELDSNFVASYDTIKTLIPKE